MGLESDKIAVIESRLLFEAINQCYGYDFTSYNLKTMVRRLKDIVLKFKLNNISEMIPKVIYDRQFFNELLLNLSVTVTDFFRDPKYYAEIREKIVPVLKTYPYINIWCAGCATGEEAYSIAIILKEEGLLERSQIYATDINDTSLKLGKKGIYPLEKMKDFTDNYNTSGGKDSFSTFFTTRYNSCIINKELKDKVLFSKHNLVGDGVFAEMNLVFCRNVLIYFNQQLQKKVLRTFHNSLIHSGFIFLGKNESILTEDVHDSFTLISRKASIYQKTK